MLLPRNTSQDGNNRFGPTPWRVMGMGMELGVLIGVLTFLGYLGDQRWDTEPWLALTGALLSTVGGVYNLSKEVMKSSKKGQSQNHRPAERQTHRPDDDPT